MRVTALKAVLSAVVLASVAYGGSIVDFTGGSVELNNDNETYGYSFTVSGASLTVTGLGVFDTFAVPLASTHPVGLWNSSGTLLATANVNGANPKVASTDSLGQWAEASISPIVLTPGIYFAGVYYNVSSEDVLVLATPNSVAGVTYLSAQYAFGTSLQFPSSTFGTTLVGPAVFTSSIPEPNSLLLLFSGIVAVAFVVRTRTVKTARTDL
jgi:hypothetical protein